MRNFSNIGVKFDNFTSFLLATLIYFLAILLLIFKATFHDLNQNFTDDKNAFMDIIAIDIDEGVPTRTAKEVADSQESEAVKTLPQEKIELENLKVQKKPEPKVEQKPIEKVEENIVKPEQKEIEEIKPEKKEIKPESKEETKDQESKKQNLNDLFATTTSNNEKLTKATSEVKSKKTGAKQSKGAISDKDAGKSQLTGIYDAFKGGVRKKLTALWSRYNGGSNNDALVSITISADGKLKSYEILELSYDSEFNQKLRDFMESLYNQDFPKPPNNEEYTFSKLKLNTQL